ncbi:MAG: 50S ribosomal protein L11 [Candidatus Pacebacteria bacterium]|nr:50S ribosomal protein L11 [Candidatus Paceibacterota bacterium]MDD3919316.1 50S ribosomal protein L11 [Candidatus Paceibacterota bacterium]
MAKKIKKIVKLHIAAGKANPAPPVGPALAPTGINMSEFCQKFNAQTQDSAGFKIPVVITVYEDKSYDFVLKEPPASQLIKKALGLEKGSSEANKKKVGKMTKAQLTEIAERKMKDLNANDMEAALKILEGSARSLGIEIID